MEAFNNAFWATLDWHVATLSTNYAMIRVVYWMEEVLIKIIFILLET